MKRYRYTGKEKDEETGLYYHGERYFACWLARWIKTDPSGISDGLNVYAYVNNRPTIKVDMTGKNGETGNPLEGGLFGKLKELQAKYAAIEEEKNIKGRNERLKFLRSGKTKYIPGVSHIDFSKIEDDNHALEIYGKAKFSHLSSHLIDPTRARIAKLRMSRPNFIDSKGYTKPPQPLYGSDHSGRFVKAYSKAEFYKIRHARGLALVHAQAIALPQQVATTFAGGPVITVQRTVASALAAGASSSGGTDKGVGAAIGILASSGRQRAFSARLSGTARNVSERSTESYRYFLHGTTTEGADDIIRGIRPLSTNTHRHDPGSFFTFEAPVKPSWAGVSSASGAHLSATHMALRNTTSNNVEVLVGRVPATVIDDIRDAMSVGPTGLYFPIPDETVFHPSAFKALNDTIQWMRLPGFPEK